MKFERRVRFILPEPAPGFNDSLPRPFAGARTGAGR